MHFYQSHLGGLYTSNKKYKFDDLYCEDCGDWDDYLGEFATWEDYIKSIDPDKDILCWSPEYLSELSGLSVEKIKELNPKLGEEPNWEEEE